MIQLITNRTQADVDSKAEKGSYGHEDLNRVEKAVEEIAAYFPQLGIGLTPVTKTDWARPGDYDPESWPTDGQMRRYLSNVEGIRDRLCPGQPLPESMEKLTWSGANEIEQALSRGQEAIPRIIQAWKYSGGFFAGEEMDL